MTGAGGGDYFHDDNDSGVDGAEVSCRCVRARVGWRSKRNVSARRRIVLCVHAIIIHKRTPNTETTKAELLHVAQLPSGKRRFRRRNTLNRTHDTASSRAHRATRLRRGLVNFR